MGTSSTVVRIVRKDTGATARTNTSALWLPEEVADGGGLPYVFRRRAPASSGNDLADRDIAPPGQEGWTRHQEKYREASFDGADGVVVQDQTEMFLNLNHHPVCAASDASHFFLLAQPPLLAGAVAEPPISPRTPPACVSPGFTNPRWLATLRSPGANFLHASGVQTSSPGGLRGH